MLWNKCKLIFFQVRKFSIYICLIFFVNCSFTFTYVYLSTNTYVHILIKGYILEKFELKYFHILPKIL